MCIISIYRNGTVNYNSKKLASESETRILTASDAVVGFLTRSVSVAIGEETTAG